MTSIQPNILDWLLGISICFLIKRLLSVTIPNFVCKHRVVLSPMHLFYLQLYIAEIFWEESIAGRDLLNTFKTWWRKHPHYFPDQRRKEIREKSDRQRTCWLSLRNLMRTMMKMLEVVMMMEMGVEVAEVLMAQVFAWNWSFCSKIK